MNSTKQHPIYGPYEPGWIEIPGFSKYEVNDMSEVRRKQTRRIRKVTVNKQVGLLDDNSKRHMVKVYHLSLLAFFPNVMRLETADHIDENNQNHNLSNLQWLPNSGSSSNTSKSNNLRPRASGPKQSKPILMYNLDGTFVKEYKSANEAAREEKLKSGNISLCCRGKRTTCGGKYIFKFKETYESLPGEVWRPIKNQKKGRSVAHVSNLGRIKTKYGVISNGKIVSSRPKYRSYSGTDVHIIVWDAFGNKNRYDLLENGKPLRVLHNDSIPVDEDGCVSNAIEHLSLDTQSENIRQSYAIGSLKKYCKPVQQLDLGGNVIAEYSSMSEAARQTNYLCQTIWKHANGKRKQTMWRLKDDDENESDDNNNCLKLRKKQKLSENVNEN